MTIRLAHAMSAGMTRELIAYLLIGATIVFVAAMTAVSLHRRRRTMLRRRGIKHYGH